MAENPKVTSKFDRMHGRPRSVQEHGIPSPDGISGTPPESAPEPTRVNADHGTKTEYHPAEHGRMARGEHAVHPTHGGGDAIEDGGDNDY